MEPACQVSRGKRGADDKFREDRHATSEPSEGAVWPNNLLPEYPFGIREKTNPEEISIELGSQGNGSIAAIVINQDPTDPNVADHVITAVNFDGEIIYVDPQLGAIVELNLESGMEIGARYR